MVTLIVLSAGIVAVFQSYLISLDRINHLANRLYAGVYLDERLQTIERNLRVHQALPFELAKEDDIDLGGKTVAFTRGLKIGQIENFNDIFKIDLSYSWKEENRTLRLSRSRYVADFAQKE